MIYRYILTFQFHKKLLTTIDYHVIIVLVIHYINENTKVKLMSDEIFLIAFACALALLANLYVVNIYLSIFKFIEDFFTIAFTKEKLFQDTL